MNIFNFGFVCTIEFLQLRKFNFFKLCMIKNLYEIEIKMDYFQYSFAINVTV